VPSRARSRRQLLVVGYDPEPGVPRDGGPKAQCAFDVLVLRISAVHTNYRIWMRSSSTYEPSDPPARLI
jgi:hypothetical protein